MRLATKNKLSFIYWFASYNLHSPSVRYRAEYPLLSLKKKYNIDSVLVIPTYQPAGIYKFIHTYLSILFFRKKNSLIVIQRVRSNFIYANLLKILVRIDRKQTVYDLDDADYIMYPDRTISYFIKHCSAISAGSRAIAQQTGKVNDNVWITSSPIFDLGIVKKDRNQIFTIGWIQRFFNHSQCFIKMLLTTVQLCQQAHIKRG